MNRDELLDKLAMELEEWPERREGHDGYVRAKRECSEVTGVNIPVEYGPPMVEAGGHEYYGLEYLQRRAELINKPSWDDAPEWAEWLSQNDNGVWCWHELKPIPDHDGWIMYNPNDEKQVVSSEGATPNGHDWRQTLERRPAFNESRADIIGQNGNDGDHYGARELNPTTSSLTNIQAREIAAEDGICSDGQPCGHPLTGDDAYCPGCPNLPDETSTYCDRCGGEYWTPPHEYCPCVDGVGSGKQSRYQDHSGDDWIDEFARTATVEEFRGAMRFTIGKYNRRMGRKDEIAQEVRKMRDYCDRWLSYEEGQ